MDENDCILKYEEAAICDVHDTYFVANRDSTTVDENDSKNSDALDSEILTANDESNEGDNEPMLWVSMPRALVVLRF